MKRWHSFVHREKFGKQRKHLGYKDINAEEEFNLLREIFMTSKIDSKRRLCLSSLSPDYLCRSSTGK